VTRDLVEREVAEREDREDDEQRDRRREEALLDRLGVEAVVDQILAATRQRDHRRVEEQDADERAAEMTDPRQRHVDPHEPGHEHRHDHVRDQRGFTGLEIGGVLGGHCANTLLDLR